MGFIEHPETELLADLDRQIDELWGQVENETGQKSHAFISWEYEGDSTFIVDRMSQVKKRISNDPDIADMLRQIDQLESEKGQVLDRKSDENGDEA